MRAGRWLCFALACAGCGDDDPCADCNDPGTRLLDAVSSATLAATVTCGAPPLATPNAPFASPPPGIGCPIVRPGGILYTGVSWSGGAVSRLHLRFGGCRYLSVALPLGSPAGPFQPPP